MSDVPATKKAKLEEESESSIGGAKTAADVVPSNRHIISRGAEAVVESITFLDMPAVVKTRVPKLYRIPQLEKMITRERTVAEARCLRRCWSAGLRVPLVLCCNVAGGVIVLEKIMGNTVKKHLLEVCGPEDHPAVATMVGEAIAQLHDHNFVHGDLTTSNMIIEPLKPTPGDGSQQPSRQLVLIDFGLSMCNASAQAKAVDLYVLERAFLSTHPEASQMFDMVLKAYNAKSKNPNPVMTKFKAVQARGRKRLAFG